MPKFPKKEADVYDLVNQMIAGYTAYPAVFPHANVPALEDALNDAHNQVIVQNCFLADARIATEAKEDALDDLVAEMKRQLKRSEVDTKDNPTALTLIGWDAKPESKAIRKPGQPRNLEATQQGPGVVYLDWKAPVPGKGGAVRSYIILRREHAPGQPFTNWTHEAISLNPEITLINQPRFIQLEYRIIAVNAGGVSVPSNVAAVVV